MKLVFFSSDNNLHSGAFRAEINLIQDLKKKGHDVTLILPYRWKGNKIAKRLGIKTKTILSIPWVCNKNKNVFSYLSHLCSTPINCLAAARTKSYLKKHNFDLAVVNTLWNGVGGAAAIQIGIPTVWHLREILETGQHKSFFNKEKALSIINKSKVCISVSNATKKYYCENFPGIIKNVYDGVDTATFFNNNKQLFKDKTTHILMMGTVNKPKGQHIGLRALNGMSQYDFDVKIVGKCWKWYKHKLLKLIPNIKNRVEFINPTKSPENYYKWADLFLMNSVGEAFGLVTVEAMMGGVAVISSKCDGGFEIIDSENNGYFYEPLNVRDLQSKIEYAINHKEETINKAINGQKRSLSNFDKKINSDAIENIYLECANKI